MGLEFRLSLLLHTIVRKYVPSNGSVPLAVTFLATVLEPVLKVPVERFALVTDPTRHVLLAGAKASLRN